MKNLFGLLFVLLLSACQQQKDKTPELRVTKSETVFSLIAQGELEAVKATPITSTSSSRRPQTIAWIADQYSLVKKGDVIVKFDGVPFQNEMDAAEFELTKLNYTRLQKNRELNNSLEDFNNESDVVDFEYLMAQKFNIDNPMLYTKIEMIDASDNEEFLEAKSTYIDNMSSHFKGKSDSEVGLIDSKSQMQKAKVDMNQENLDQLEILAPHDGIVVLKKGWDGSIPQAGKSVFPGMGLASIPDLSSMKAKIFVPEIEAVGLKKEQKVDIKLHAFPNLKFTGTISMVSKSAQPKKRDNPVKFFTVTVVINEKDEAILLPGQRLDATIFTTEKSENIVVPIQTIFRKDGKSWVYHKAANGDYRKKDVMTGICSTSQCIVEAGLSENDIMALIEPKKESSKDKEKS
jgi:multidrug efflux pump subunit AcrA (membrane-fusion protein)